MSLICCLDHSFKKDSDRRSSLTMLKRIVGRNLVKSFSLLASKNRYSMFSRVSSSVLVTTNLNIYLFTF